MVDLNYWAILGSAVIMLVLGGLWYGPLFGKQWSALSGIKIPEKMDDATKQAMMRSYGLMALGSLIVAYVMAHSVIFAGAYLNTDGVRAGLQAGFWNWLGFVAPATMGAVLWERKPWTLWFINAGYYLVGLLVIGVVLSVWV